MRPAKVSLNNPLLLFALCGLYPAVFHAGNNWWIYTNAQLLLLVCVTPAAALIVGGATYALGSLIFTKVPLVLWRDGPTVSPELAQRILSGVFASLTSVVLLHATLFPDPDGYVLSGTIVAIIALFIVALVAKTGYSFINFFLFALIGLASSGWLMSRTKYANVDISADFRKERALFDNIELRKTPNIYLVHLESYHSLEAMREIYDFDNTPFENELDRLGITVDPDAHSNYQATMTTLIAIFGMRHHYFKWNTGNHDAFGARAFLGGKTYNPVLSVLENNGYKLQFITRKDIGGLFVPGESLDYAYPRPLVASVFEIFQLDIVARAIAWRERRSARSEVALSDSSAMDEYSVQRLHMLERIQFASDSESPYFTFLAPPGTFHSDPRRRWTDLKDWEQEYPAQITAANPHLVELFEFIVEKDPEAVILLYGDHGAVRYRDIWIRWGGGGRDLVAILENRGIDGPKLALDIFGTIFGVRYPGGDPALFDGATHVDMFRLLFSDLSGDASLADSRASDDSYFLYGVLYIAIRDGELLDPWERFAKPE